jgi:parallel beta-helix repeat protein
MNKHTLFPLAAAVMLAACGGGAADTAPPPPAPAAAPVVAEPAEDASLLDRPDEQAAPDIEQDAEPGAGPASFALAGYAPPAAAGQAIDAAAALETDAAPDPQALAAPGAVNLYVAPNGSDSGSGTEAQPFRSLSRAARAARPGTKVFVAPGQYSGGFRTSASGAPGARISYISSVKWGARIMPPADGASKAAWDNRGDHVDIVGFDIDGSAYRGGRRWTHGIYSGGSYVSIRNNHVHHLAQGNGCARSGGAAIGVDSYYHGVQADVIANLVHDIGPAGCRFVQGIYVSTSGRIKNNVIYRVAEGGIHLWHDARNVVITNNTVTTSNTGIIVGGGNLYYATGPNDYTAVYSNIVYDNKMGISEQGKTGLNNTYRNNLVFQNSSYDWRLKNGLQHSGTVSAAPQFVGNARSLQPNLHPGSGSPAIGKASALHAESTDFEGRPRNAQAGYDIGAFQH